MTTPPRPGHQPAEFFPLETTDPVKVGDFWLDSRLTASPAGAAFCAHADESDPVMLIMLSEGAASDPAARARFSGEVNAMHIDTVVARGGQGQDKGRMAVRFQDEDDDPIVASHHPLAPWVALAFDGSTMGVMEAKRVLAAVDLVHTPQLGSPAGPGFQLHWWPNARGGTSRSWPLTWPGRKDRAGWISLLTSFLLMLMISAVGVLLAILVFQNQPVVAPPPPVPTENGDSSAPPSGAIPSSSSSSGSSPSDSQSSDSSGEEPSRSDTPSMQQPSGAESGPSSPSPERKL